MEPKIQLGYWADLMGCVIFTITVCLVVIFGGALSPSGVAALVCLASALAAFVSSAAAWVWGVNRLVIMLWLVIAGWSGVVAVWLKIAEVLA